MKFIEKMAEIEKDLVKNQTDLNFDRWLYLKFIRYIIEDGPLAASQKKPLLKEIDKLQDIIKDKKYNDEQVE